jgi:hypothetical protein
MTRCVKVAWRKGLSYEGLSVEQGRRKNKTGNIIARGTQIERMLGRRQLMHQESTNGTRNRDVKEGTNGTRNLDVKEHLCLVNERTTREIYRKSAGLEITKPIARCTVGLQRIKDWTL